VLPAVHQQSRARALAEDRPARSAARGRARRQRGGAAEAPSTIVCIRPFPLSPGSRRICSLAPKQKPAAGSTTAARPHDGEEVMDKTSVHDSTALRNRLALLRENEIDLETALRDGQQDLEDLVSRLSHLMDQLRDNRAEQQRLRRRQADHLEFIAAVEDSF